MDDKRIHDAPCDIEAAIAEFRENQAALELTNQAVADLLATSVRNVEDWRCRTPPKPLVRKFLRVLRLIKTRCPEMYDHAAEA